MISYISGYSDTHDILYCPYCGEKVGMWRADGTGFCDSCNHRFAVIYVDDEAALAVQGGGGEA